MHVLLGERQRRAASAALQSSTQVYPSRVVRSAIMLPRRPCCQYPRGDPCPRVRVHGGARRREADVHLPSFIAMPAPEFRLIWHAATDSAQNKNRQHDLLKTRAALSEGVDGGSPVGRNAACTRGLPPDSRGPGLMLYEALDFTDCVYSTCTTHHAVTQTKRKTGP